MAEKKHNPFKLSQFMRVDPDHVAKLKEIGITSAEKLLSVASTKAQRTALSKETCIPESELLELVRLSDLARLPGVKGIRARLYYDAGVVSVEKMAAWEPEALRLMITDYVNRTNFEGIPPLPKEVSSTVANAQKLPKIVEY